MTGREHDPEREHLGEGDPVVDELEGYAHATRAVPSADLADRIMAAVEQAPPPRRGIAGWLGALIAGRASGHRWAQAGVMAAALVLAIGGIFATGELLQLVNDGRNAGSSSSPAVETFTPSPQPTVSPTPTERPTPTLEPSPTESEDEGETPEPTLQPTQPPPPSPSPSEEDEHGSPKPTSSPRSSDDSHSGPG